jgi:hypothetical protein
MKGKTAVIIAVILLVAVILFVVINNLYVRRTVSELLSLLNSLPSVPDGGADVLLDEFRLSFKEKLPWLGLSISYNQLASIEGGAAAVASYSQSRDTNQYRAALATLRESVLGLWRNEKFSMENII